MPSHASVAASVRAQKEQHPDQFCPKCLWRIVKRDGSASPCKNHPVTVAKCVCPYVLTSVGRHTPSCPKYENPADASPESEAEDDAVIAVMGDDAMPEFVECISGEPLPGNPWHVAGLYFASAYDAECYRREQAAKARRQAERLTAVIARMAGEQQAAD